MDLDELTEIAGREMAKHGLYDWTFSFGNAKRRLGVCKYRSKRIEIARYYARNSAPESVLDTLRHEIAHAIAGPAARHGPVWKAVAIQLGATPRACDNSQASVVKPGDWQATCPTCEMTYHRYRRPRSLTGYHCKCPARSPVHFEFKGDSTLNTRVAVSQRSSSKWEAKCEACGSVHRRMRRPKAGVWRCKCAHRCEITWRCQE